MKTKTKKLQLEKFKIAKLDNLYSIRGGNSINPGEGEGGDPRRSNKPWCPDRPTGTNPGVTTQDGQ